MSHQFKKRLLVLSILGTSLLQTTQAANIPMSELPLTSAGSSFSNVFLALSVEFPTAGAAHVYSYHPTNKISSGTKNTISNVEHLKSPYKGYFNPYTCYELQGSGNNRYFTPVAQASTSDLSCNNNNISNRFSGNILNWATMSALDVYRSAMTGGNRAKGIGTDNSAYNDGDTTNITYLRRANVVSGQNQSSQYGMLSRTINSISKANIKKYLPSTYIRSPNNNLNNNVSIVFDNKGFTFDIKDTTSSNNTLSNTGIPVVVEVCQSAYLEDNCTQYGSNYKPEGLMQKNVQRMHFSALGYLNIPGGATDRSGGHQISGGVVRSELNSIRNEFTESTGQYVVNPYPQTGVNNSGSINYLNKFGDANGYKTNDPVAELYYTALRYIRGMGYVKNANWMPSNLTSAEKDGFPVININNQDPLKSGNNWDLNKVCSPNTIMLIGDTNSHADGNLPGLDDNNGFRPNDDTIDTQEWINKLKASELQYIGAPANSTFMNGWFDKNGNTGSSRSPAGLPALAYWANTQNIRSDVPNNHKVNVKTFAIDVLENGGYKTETNDNRHWVRSAYYLAGKYGGFNDSNGDGIPNRTNTTEWTDDNVAAISPSATYKHGMPRYFALANNPDSMIEALDSAFDKAASNIGRSQTGVATSGNPDLVDIDNDLIIRSVYVDNNWSGDIYGLKLIESTQNNTLYEAQTIWQANTKLYEQIRDFTHSSRKILTTTPTGVATEFTANNVNAFGSNITGMNANLVNYIRGDVSNEGLFRSRSNNKLGTVINSEVVAIRKPTSHLNGCTYTDENVFNRSTMYGFASNDGMYHILDTDGNEKLAYIPANSLPKLSAYATPEYDHQYINDGLSVNAEVCFASGEDGARSIVVGSGGRGGKSIYALNITNMDNPGTDNFLWEFTDPDLGHFLSKPVISKDNNGNPIAIVSSGYNADNLAAEGYLYILQLNKTGPWVEGSNYQKIQLGNAGVGGPFGYDADRNGTVDHIYVGDYDGKLWKVNAQSSGTWSVAFNGSPLYSLPGKHITATPYVQVTRGRLTVFFGTGSYLSVDDLGTSEQNHAYGIFDNNAPVSHSDLLNQTIAAENDASLAGSLWMLSSNALDSHHKGWYITLRPGQIIIDQAHVQSKRAVFFNVFTPRPASNCLVSSETFLLGADVRSGAQYEEELFDTNFDGAIDGSDGLGGFYKLGNMLGPVGTMIQSSDGKLFYMVIGSDGSLTTIELNNLDLPPQNLKYQRLSWREIF